MTHPYNPRARARYIFSTVRGEILAVCDCTQGRARALARVYSQSFECEVRAEVRG